MKPASRVALEEAAKQREDQEEERVIDLERSEDETYKFRPKWASKADQVREKSRQLFKLEYNQATAVAYLFKKMPYHYGVFMRILEEIKVRKPDFKPESMLDYGAGLGSGVWAGAEVFPDLQRIGAVEPSTSMRKLGKFLADDINDKYNTLWVDSLSMIPGTGGERGKFDLIMVGYVLQEVATPKARVLIMEALWSRLKENGVLVFVEPGSPKGYRYVMSFRDWILEKERSEACIVAPCPHHDTCPLFAQPNSWCHFSTFIQRVPKQYFPKLPKEDGFVNEKYSYLVVQKGKTPNVEFETVDDVDEAWKKSYFWPRVVRPNMKRQQHVVMDLCSGRYPDQLDRRVIGKSHGIEGGYKRARRMRWGDLWYFEERIPNKYRKERRFGKRLW